MKFGMGSTTELTQKCQGQSTNMKYVHPNEYINIYPRFSIELPLIVSPPDSVSLPCQNRKPKQAIGLSVANLESQ